MTPKPSMRLERELQRCGARLVAGVDEVGRGALAGPVTVGVVVVSPRVRAAPSGLRDSKLLTPAARAALEPALQRWATAWGVGHAEPREIDTHGIIAALRLAASRAFMALGEPPDAVILDGNHDYLGPSRDPGVAGHPGQAVLEVPGLAADPFPTWRVTRVRADQTCSAVAAASVLAKCARDRLMVSRHADHPWYRWDANKGYAAPEHIAGLAQRGPCSLHRLSWRLPGVPGPRLSTDAQQALPLT